MLQGGNVALMTLTRVFADCDGKDLASWEPAAVAEAAGVSDAFVHLLLQQSATVSQPATCHVMLASSVQTWMRACVPQS